MWSMSTSQDYAGHRHALKDISDIADIADIARVSSMYISGNAQVSLWCIKRYILIYL